jgi:broad specificity phosphatase PhoE
MNHLYWVRHGESLVNLTKEFSYRLVDYALTPKGVLQAQQTADYFVDKNIDGIYCSPLKRAVETAEIIGKRLGLSVLVKENFREMNVGDLEKSPPSAENWAVNHQIFSAWLTGDLSMQFPNGEDGHTLLDRIRTGLDEVMSQHDHANLIVVGHGGSFMASMRHLCPEIDIEWLRNQSVENCSITEILLEHVNGHVSGKLIHWASHAHLSGGAAELISGVPDNNHFGGK